MAGRLRDLKRVKVTPTGGDDARVNQTTGEKKAFF